MVLGKKEGINPLDLANQIITLLNEKFSDNYSEIFVAGPGFINVKLNKNIVLNQIKKKFLKKIRVWQK